MKLLVGFFLVASMFVGIESVTYPHHLTLKENVFDVHWYVNENEDRFYFKIVATTTGWAALALTTNPGAEDMKDYDIALGGVRNVNITYLKDYWSTAETKPTLDTKQNLNLTSATEANGKTTIEFNRKANTEDTSQDTQFKKNVPVFLAWAIGREDATDDNTYQKHPDKMAGGRGHTNVGYYMYNGSAATTSTTSTTVIPTTTGNEIVPSLVNALILIQLAMFVIY